MNLKIGERYHNEIEEENYGAYKTNASTEPVYIVWWESKPWNIDADCSKMMDGNTYMWTNGDYLCCGTWLWKMDNGRNWYTMDTMINHVI